MFVALAVLALLHTKNSLLRPGTRSGPESTPVARSLEALSALRNPLQVASEEELLRLEPSFKEDGFLKNIKEYGNARMARRAVGILKKMTSFRVIPTVIHYEGVLKACEQSEQYALCVSVMTEMQQLAMPLSVSSFEALISVSEKTGHNYEAIDFFNQMLDAGVNGSMEAYNSCLQALCNIGESDAAYELLRSMKEKNITRDVVTYTAATWAAEKQGDGLMALQLLDAMRSDGIDQPTATYNGALWACTKGGFWKESLGLFSKMRTMGVPMDHQSYSAAIWATEQGEHQHNKALELLKEMKQDLGERTTQAFDGAISTLKKERDWQQALELLRWMQRDSVPRGEMTYSAVITLLDDMGKYELIDELYQQALRDGFFSPWVKRTRQLDVRGMPLACAKVALKMVLQAMNDGRLAVFPLDITVGTVERDEDDQVVGIRSSLDVDALAAHLYGLDLHVALRSRVGYDEDDNLVPYRHEVYNRQFSNEARPTPQLLVPSPGEGVKIEAMKEDSEEGKFYHKEITRVVDENTERLTLTKETINQWIECQKNV